MATSGRWLEVNEDGRVTREIGFDPSRRGIVATPLGNNLGIFTDSDHAPDGLGEPIGVTEFERAWSDVSSARGV